MNTLGHTINFIIISKISVTLYFVLGEYICRATNRWGTATTVANINCIGRHGIISESQLPDGMTAERLKDLERGPISVAPKEDEQMGPPRFLSQIESATVEESESVRFECRVEPKDDPRLRIEWYRNGKLLPSGHRYRNVYDLGFVSLDILYVYGEDSGEYGEFFVSLSFYLNKKKLKKFKI